MTNERLIQHAQLHLTAVVRVAQHALRCKDIRDMQQNAESVSDYPEDIVRRISHQLQEPIPPVPPLPLSFPPYEPDDESPRDFATRCLLQAIEIAKAGALLSDLKALRTHASLILAYGDAAEVRLRIAIKEARK